MNATHAATRNARAISRRGGLARATARWLLLVALAFSGGCAHAGAPRAAERLAEPAPTTWRDGSDLLTLRMAAVVTSMGREGYTDSGVFARGFLPPGERRTQRVTLPAHTCMTWVAMGSAGIDDLDAALYTPRGDLVVDDDASDARPTITTCAGASRHELYFRLLSYQGGGSFLAVMFTRPITEADATLALSAPGERDGFRELARTLSKRGFVDRADVVELDLGSQEELSISIPAEAGHCYAVLAEPSAGLEALSLRVLDPRGHELANGRADAEATGIQWCSRETVATSMLVRATRGAGTARLMRFVGPEERVGGASALWLGEPTPSPALWSEAAKQASASSASFFSRRGELEQGVVQELAVPSAPGRCEVFRAELGRGLAVLTMSLADEDGRVLASATGQAPEMSLEVCGRHGRATLTLVSRRGFGAFALTAARAD